MEHVAAKIDKRHGITGPGVSEGELIDLDKKVVKPKFNELEFLNKLQKSERTG